MKKTFLPVLSLKRLILLPFIVILVILVSGSIYNYLYQEKSYAQVNIGQQFLSAKRAFDIVIQQETEKLSTALEIIITDPVLKQAMIAEDRDALLQQSNPLFKRLREKHAITHFYFHRPDRINFLRVHSPDRFGDLINRFSARQAEATNAPASALELGPLGLFTLRVVVPWYANGKLIGYIELGEEIGHLYQHIEDVLKINLYVILDKKVLSREGWEAGMKLLGHQAEWNLMSESVVAFTTVHNRNMIALQHFIDSGALNLNLNHTVQQFSQNEQTFKAYALPLTNAGQPGRQIGSMLFLRDVSDMENLSMRHTLFTVALGIAIIGIVFLFFFLLTRYTQQQLESSR